MSMDFASDVLAWDQAPQWGEKANNKNSKNVEEQSEPRGGLGRGKWRRSLETCLWCCHSMIPDSGIMLWLVKCLHVDRFAVRLTVLRSFNVTFLLFRQKIFKRQILSKQYKFLCKTFRLSLLQEEQKICLWSVAKRKTKHSTNKAFLALSSDKLRSHLQRNGLINRRSNGTALQSRSWQERDKTQKSRMTMAKSHACKKETSARRLVQR